jgi:spoIIIJ-associated protein
MGFLVQVQHVTMEGDMAKIQVMCEDFRVLIGEGGQTLSDLQYLLNMLFRRTTEEKIFLDLDIAGYKEKKIEYLKDMAREAADQVAITKKEKILDPMRAYERRIVHMELSSREDVETESVGENQDRRIVIKAKP